MVHLGKGLYKDNKNINNFYLSSILYSPSYISFQSALSFYGLIPERVYTVTCATYCKNKTKVYNTPFGDFMYQDVQKEVFHLGKIIIEENGYSYFIATKEKALLDTISKVRSNLSCEDMINYIYNDLRINEIDFEEALKDVYPFIRQNDLIINGFKKDVFLSTIDLLKSI